MIPWALTLAILLVALPLKGERGKGKKSAERKESKEEESRVVDETTVVQRAVESKVEVQETVLLQNSV